MVGKVYEIELAFTEDLLGTAPLNKELYGDYIASKASQPVNDELETINVDEEVEKGTTGFHRVDGAPILYDYVIKGFCKDACSMMKRVEKSESTKITAFKKIIDGLLFVTPRQIPIQVKGEMGILERPLRAQTAQGERVALSRSETVPAGSAIHFEINVLGSISETLLREWLDYGGLRGLGCWRNAGYGKFEYKIKVKD